MRLGKRERAALKVKKLASLGIAARVYRTLTGIAPGEYASAWRRFYPALRPVGIPRLNWSLGLPKDAYYRAANGNLFRNGRVNTCPVGWKRDRYQD